MELKRYQKDVLDRFEGFLKEMKAVPNKEKAASFGFMSLVNGSYKPLPDSLSNRPFICIQVPTGGGKTFIASHVVGSAYTHFGPLQEKNDVGLVMWLVPSDAIRTQTVQKLRDRNDPVREALDERFDNKIVVLDILEARNIKKSDIGENIAVIVATYASFKREDTDGLKVFQDNGGLMAHFDDKTDEKQVYSLVEVIKRNTPLIVVDEGHNAQTTLSLDMFKNLNPSMVIEFTATPRSLSNILVSVPATELKQEHMIKMPIQLETKTLWQDTLRLAYEKRKELEKIAKKLKENSYIRPILLIQAEQEKETTDKVHVAEVVQYLEKELKISRTEIAIRTGKQDELEGVNLFSTDTQIRYIVTVDALKEGWDCSFAYVLASVKNLGAHVAVKQLIGRVLRLPYAREHEFGELNRAYVFASAPNFQDAARLVIEGLKGNGYEVDESDLTTKNTLDTLKTEYFRHIEGEAQLPLIAFDSDDTYRELDYSADLIGETSILDKADPNILIDSTEDGGTELIDINKKGDLVREQAQRKYSENAEVDFSKEQLIEWLLKKVSRSYFSLQNVQGFVTRAINQLIPRKLSVEKAHRKRYLLLEKINQNVDTVINAYTHKQFLKFLKDKKLTTDSKIVCKFGKQIYYNKVFTRALYNKHLFSAVGDMNSEEQALADAINRSEAVLWWLRNPEQDGFYIQGWLSNKFRPDFILKTKKGHYFVLEYKGDQLITNDDSKYKKEIGEIWARVAGEKYHFMMVEKQNVSDVDDIISAY